MSDQSKPPISIKPDIMPIAPNGALGPAISAIVAAAGRGDLEAQRLLFGASACAMFQADPTCEDSKLVAMEAVMIGRLIASHGHPEDVRRLAGALCQASEIFRSCGCQEWGDRLMAECVSVLEQLAEAGDDFAALSSETLIKGREPKFFELVRELRRNAVVEA